MPKQIVVASTNPVKLLAVLNGFQRMFPGDEFEIQGVSVPSGVSDQPLSDAETLRATGFREQQRPRRRFDRGIDRRQSLIRLGRGIGIDEENVHCRAG